MSKIKFGIDIDGTITRPDTFIPYLNKDFGLNLSIDDITKYDFSAFMDVKKEILYEWFRQNEALVYQQSPLTDGVREVMNKWGAIGETYFISARRSYLLDITQQWFTDNHIDYHHIELIGSHDKIETIQKHKIEIFFEDKHDNAVEISEKCQIPVLLFNTAYNQGHVPSYVIRVNNWKEAEDWVNQWFGIRA